MKASFKEISNKPEVSNEEVQSILDLDFIPDNMVEIIQEAQDKRMPIFLKDDKIDMVLPIIHKAKQIVLEDLEIIDIVMPLHIEDKKVVFE